MIFVIFFTLLALPFNYVFNTLGDFFTILLTFCDLVNVAVRSVLVTILTVLMRLQIQISWVSIQPVHFVK